MSKEPPQFPTTTYLTPKKRRVSRLKDRALTELRKIKGRPLSGAPRLSQKGLTFEGAYLLPQMSVLEVYKDANDKEVGFLFHNLDVWLTYDTGVDVSPLKGDDP